MAKHSVAVQGVEFHIETDSLPVARYLPKHFSSPVDQTKIKAHLGVMLEPCFIYGKQGAEQVIINGESLVFDQTKVAGYFNLVESRGLVRISEAEALSQLLSVLAKWILDYDGLHHVS